MSDLGNEIGPGHRPGAFHIDRILAPLLAWFLSSHHLTLFQAAAGQAMNYGLFPPGSFSVSTLFLGQECSCEVFQGRWPHDVPLCMMELNAHLAGERSRAGDQLSA